MRGVPSPRLDSNAIRPPSGDQTGPLFNDASKVKRDSVPRVRSTSHKSLPEPESEGRSSANRLRSAETENELRLRIVPPTRPTSFPVRSNQVNWRASLLRPC